MTTGRLGPGRKTGAATRLAALGRLDFSDFALLDDATLRSTLARVPPGSFADLLVRHPAVLRRVLELGLACRTGPARPTPDPFPLGALESASASSVRPSQRLGVLVLNPTGPTLETLGVCSCILSRALVLSHAFDLLAAKSPALYETLPWFDWDTSVALRGRPPWRTRFLLAGDSATVVAARCRRAAGVTIVESRPRLADYARRKLRLVGAKRWEVNPGPLEDAVRAGGHDLALLALPLPHGPDAKELFPLLAGPAFVLALRPGAEEGITPPSGWQAVTVRTAAGPRPGWARPGS